jgi:hypothetical protein
MMAKPCLLSHPKFFRLVRTIAEPDAHVLGYLEFMWQSGFARGDPYLGDALDVEAAAHYPGEPGKLCKALLACRFLDQVKPGGYAIHDFFENAPDYVRSRERMRRHRERKAAEKQSDEEPDESEPADVLRNCYATVTPGAVTVTLSKPNQTRPIEDASASSCTETENPSPVPASDPSEEKIILTFPVVGKGAKEWHLLEAKLVDFREAFPSLDVIAECRKALCWINANPDRKKTARGMGKFLYSWLSRSQDSGRAAKPVAEAVETDEQKRERIRREREEDPAAQRNGRKPTLSLTERVKRKVTENAP